MVKLIIVVQLLNVAVIRKNCFEGIKSLKNLHYAKQLMNLGARMHFVAGCCIARLWIDMKT